MASTPRGLSGGRAAAGSGLIALLLVCFFISPAAAQITRVVDEQGVIHITNRPLPGRPEPGQPQAPKPQPAVMQDQPVPQVRLAAAANSAPVPAQAPPRSALQPVPGTNIHRWVDEQGVIHITNQPVNQPVPGAPPAKGRPAPAPGIVDDDDDDDDEGEASQAVNSPVPQVKLVAAGPGDLLPPREARPPQDPAPGGNSPGTGRTIRSFRDEQGVLHIVNREPARSPPGPLPPPERSFSLAAARAPAPPGPEFPGLGRVAAPDSGPSPPGAPRPVAAFRDEKGVLHLTNIPPPPPRASPGRGGLARASPESLSPFIQEAARLYGLPAPLVHALIREESNYVIGAVSPKGAMGLMQLMPGTAAFMGVRDPFDPRENILAGCGYFRLLLDYFQQSLPLALAAYNAGYMRVVAAQYRIPAIKETQEFVYRVLGRYYLHQRQGQPTPNI